MAEQTQQTTPAPEQQGPPAPATASNETVTLTSLSGDQAGVDSALGITTPPATTEPAPQATESASEAPATEPASETTPEADQLPTVQPGDTPRVQDRINTLTRRNKDYERKIAMLEAEVKALSQPSEPDMVKEPDPADFGTDTKRYVEAVSRWAAQQVLQEQTKTRQEQATTAQAEAAKQHDASSWHADILAVQAKHEDYGAVMTKAATTEADTPAMHQMLQTLQQVPNGAEVFYTLAKQPGELTRISTLPPMEQTAELVLEARKLSANATTSPPADTPATPAPAESTPATPATPTPPASGVSPTPLTPVVPTGGPGEVVLNEFSSHDDYLRWRAQQVPP